MPGTPTILEVENAIVDLLKQPLADLNVRVIGFPDDWEKSGQVNIKSSAYVTFQGKDFDEPLVKGVRGCGPVYQSSHWSYNILLVSQRLRKGNPSTASIYSMIDATQDALAGQRPFSDMGPIYVQGVEYSGRDNGFWQFIVSVMLDGKVDANANSPQGLIMAPQMIT